MGVRLLETEIIVSGTKTEYAGWVSTVFSVVSVVVGSFPFLRYATGFLNFKDFLLDTLTGDFFVILLPLAGFFYLAKWFGVRIEFQIRR